LTLHKKDDVERELSLPQKVWLYVLLGCFFAMFFGMPPGVPFWALLGVGLLLGSALVVLALEVLNKPGR
jgi:hypothetical protein